MNVGLLRSYLALPIPVKRVLLNLIEDLRLGFSLARARKIASLTRATHFILLLAIWWLERGVCATGRAACLETGRRNGFSRASPGRLPGSELSRGFFSLKAGVFVAAIAKWFVFRLATATEVNRG
jgi:hypothetical protein